MNDELRKKLQDRKVQSESEGFFENSPERSRSDHSGVSRASLPCNEREENVHTFGDDVPDDLVDLLAKLQLTVDANDREGGMAMIRGFNSVQRAEFDAFLRRHGTDHPGIASLTSVAKVESGALPHTGEAANGIHANGGRAVPNIEAAQSFPTHGRAEEFTPGGGYSRAVPEESAAPGRPRIQTRNIAQLLG